MTMPSGWYAGPWNETPLRWWDGTRWTPATTAPGTGPPTSRRARPAGESVDSSALRWIWQPAVRVAASFLLGVAAGLFAGLVYHAKWLDCLLIGWGSLAFMFTAWTWLIIWRFNAADTQRHASEVEPDSEFVRWFIAGAAALSLAAVGRMLLETADRHGPAALAVVSIAISWFAIHTTYALTYAKCYYKRHPGGIDFNRKKEEPRYSDFAYLACTVGMSFAVSDTNLTTWEMRRTALGHSLLSYLFGTVIIASIVNLVGGL